MKDIIWSPVKTYINYFGVDATITRKGLMLFLIDTLDNHTSDEICQHLDKILRDLSKASYISKIDKAQYFINKTIPLNLEYTLIANDIVNDDSK
jgi:hypothetical protein